MYKVYVKVNESGFIADVNSSAFLPDLTNWVEIDSGTGIKYHHAQGNYFSENIYTESGVCRYRLVDGAPVECTTEEIAEQEEANQTDTPQQTLEERVTDVESDVASLTAAVEKGLSL